jgi:hypothetical protein
MIDVIIPAWQQKEHTSRVKPKELEPTALDKG